ncbi:hypothetical protein A2368_04695 [Candidatus Collierbacteria bacterium RIFOXYB1_FULL_49_13]|uniref:Uncharacterized protein n=1 Tax=Candidatus Collierbacteria bacterium RIFOXYB1_FULL_49_13 TaxID=1817728 RepID=A0A1F5FJL6_9BACT|nr:MAG: hypothetical protein A2368_04695 [Candidatus Collierbacteria bacterium RIFOXYB1_FULL_49_13]
MFEGRAFRTARKRYLQALQRHHDYYVKLKRTRESAGLDLDPGDQVQYDVAMSREASGEVKPLK